MQDGAECCPGLGAVGIKTACFLGMHARFVEGPDIGVVIHSGCFELEPAGIGESCTRETIIGASSDNAAERCVRGVNVCVLESRKGVTAFDEVAVRRQDGVECAVGLTRGDVLHVAGEPVAESRDGLDVGLTVRACAEQPAQPEDGLLDTVVIDVDVAPRGSDEDIFGNGRAGVAGEAVQEADMAKGDG